MSAVIRIRGLPYSARADDIIDFFKDVKIKDGKRGIFFPQGPNGRSNGEAFIELESSGEIDKATAHHNEHMGLFQSSKSEMNNAMGRNQNSYSRREYVVRLRGLPYDTEKKEIYAFFNGLEIAPNGIGLLVDHMGRCTGEAYVQFTSSEMLARAKEKHMEKIGHRWLLPGQLTGGLGIRVCFHDDASVFICLTKESDWNCTLKYSKAVCWRPTRQYRGKWKLTVSSTFLMVTVSENRSGGGPITGRGARDNYPGSYYSGPKGSYGPPPGMGPAYGRGPPPGRPGPYARPPPPSGHPSYNSPPRGMGGPYGMSGG
ncbi:Heterogeneous nuclear ribonucleoprotein H, partial [Fasciolopsis buskii]